MNAKETNIPIIAVVGRPNVGKSTLFNRLIGKRVAIEAKEPGTTRDRLVNEISWCGQNYLLVDTAGLINPTNEILSESIKATELAILEADLILFVVDFRDGLTDADLKIAKKLQMSKKTVILVANKCDSKFTETDIFKFRRAGFENIALISAISGKSTGDLLDLIFKSIGKHHIKIDNAKNNDCVSVAIAGRPNVGKSTLINQLLGENRMIVSATPNTTRDSQDTIFRHKGRDIKLIDTAGISKKARVDRDSVESFAYLRSIRAISDCQIVIYIMSAEEEIAALDLNVIGQAKKLGKSIIIAINKCDLWENMEEEMLKKIAMLQKKLNFMPYLPVVFISAKDKTHLNNLLNQTLKAYESRNSVFDQNIIDQILEDAKFSQSGTRYFNKLKFERTNPPVFKLSTAKNQKPHFSHLRYLENKIRDIYPLPATPIFIDWQKS